MLQYIIRLTKKQCNYNKQGRVKDNVTKPLCPRIKHSKTQLCINGTYLFNDYFAIAHRAYGCRTSTYGAIALVRWDTLATLCSKYNKLEREFRVVLNLLDIDKPQRHLAGERLSS